VLKVVTSSSERSRQAVGRARRSTAPGSARERILEAAYQLFARHGVRAVGIDAIVARSGVARMSLYHHFASKDDLVLSVLQRRDERWTKQWLLRQVELRTDDPSKRLLAFFDLFDEWFRDPDFEGCPFIKVILEVPEQEHRLHAASADYLAQIRSAIANLASKAGIAEPDRFARHWHILLKGSVVTAAEGDRSAASVAKEVAAVFLASRLPAEVSDLATERRKRRQDGSPRRSASTRSRS
jgi:AcrR family transcriptional regulator